MLKFMYIGVLTVFCAATTWADTHYVSLSGTNNSPYTNGWADAATNIQLAVSATTAGDTILVSNGTYTLTSQVSFASSTNIVLQSVNGRDFTFVNGNYPNTTNRCFSITVSGVVIDGFTITNGFASSNVYIPTACGGGGIYFSGNSKDVTIKNCTISKNQAHTNPNWGMACGGIWISGNIGIGIVSNCIISYNTAVTSAGGGIGASGSQVSTLVNCDIFSNNAVTGSGGGVRGCSLDNCRVYGNSAGSDGGGIYYYSDTNSYIRNCLIKDNSCTNQGGGIVCKQSNNSNAIRNCTIVSNYAANSGASGGGGISFYVDSTTTATNICVYNSIIYNNRSANGQPNIATNASAISNSFYFCCTSSTNNLSVYNCITNVPMFVDTNNANYRLSRNSPCINTGTNQDWMTGTVDLDRHSRIDRLSGCVDMGAYEFVRSGTIIKVK